MRVLVCFLQAGLSNSKKINILLTIRRNGAAKSGEMSN
jgi:hypothetical protein